MSDWFENGKAPQPPQEQGGDEPRAEGAGPQGPIVLAGMGILKPLSFGAALAWCVAAGVCAGFSPIIAPLFTGFAYVLMAGNGGARERAIACVALIVPAVAAALILRFAGLEDAVFACIAGIAGGSLYLSGRLTPGLSCMAVAVLGMLLLGVSEGIARLAGTSLGEQFGAILDAYLSSMDGALPIESRALLDNMRAIVNAIWPAAFFMIAFAGFVLSIGGAQVAARRQLVDTGKQQPFELFDLPLWVVGLLIASLVILALSRVVPAFSGVLTTIGGTMVATLRLAFTTQGFAVLSWFKRSRGWLGIVGLIISVIALYLEFNMFVLTIVGVLDVWVNMRRLNRGVRVTIQDPTDQS